LTEAECEARQTAVKAKWRNVFFEKQHNKIWFKTRYVLSSSKRSTTKFGLKQDTYVMSSSKSSTTKFGLKQEQAFAL
jgi:hypothetical protein